MLEWLTTKFKASPAPRTSVLAGQWDVDDVNDDGIFRAGPRWGFCLSIDGIDAAMFSADRMNALHDDGRAALRLDAGEEVQLVFRKRVAFSRFIEAQLKRATLASTAYGRRLLLDRLANQVDLMSREPPEILAQSLTVCFWSAVSADPAGAPARRALVRSMFTALGCTARTLDRRRSSAT